MLVRPVIVALLLSLVSCSTCSSTRRPRASRVVKVRWPVTAPLKIVKVPDAPAEEQPPQGGPGVKVRPFEHDGLHVLEVILGEAEFDDALPMVVLLHGRGDRPRVPGGPFSRASTAMRLILPRAPTPLGTGFTWLPVSVTEGKTELLSMALEARAKQLAELVEWLRMERPTLGKPIVAGFSQGAMLSFTLALRHPQTFAIALPAAGWVPPSLMPEAVIESEGRIRIRTLHGADDLIVPLEPTRAVVNRLRELSWDIELEAFEGVAHTMTAEMNARFETWLEEALNEQAPRLGGGLGETADVSEDYPPVEPLDRETIEALIEATPPPPEDAEAPTDADEDESSEAEPSDPDSADL